MLNKWPSVVKTTFRRRTQFFSSNIKNKLKLRNRAACNSARNRDSTNNKFLSLRLPTHAIPSFQGIPFRHFDGFYGLFGGCFPILKKERCEKHEFPPTSHRSSNPPLFVVRWFPWNEVRVGTSQIEYHQWKLMMPGLTDNFEIKWRNWKKTKEKIRHFQIACGRFEWVWGWGGRSFAHAFSSEWKLCPENAVFRIRQPKFVGSLSQRDIKNFRSCLTHPWPRGRWGVEGYDTRTLIHPRILKSWTTLDLCGLHHSLHILWATLTDGANSFSLFVTSPCHNNRKRVETVSGKRNLLLHRFRLQT